jgi:hypothetical protein
MERAVVAYETSGDVRYAEAARINVGYALMSLGRNAEASTWIEDLANGTRHSMRAQRAIGLLKMLVDARSGKLSGAALDQRVASSSAFIGDMWAQYSQVFYALAGQIEVLIARLNEPTPANHFWDLRALPAIGLTRAGRAAEAVSLLTSRPHLAEMFGSPEFDEPVFHFAMALALDGLDRTSEAREALRRALNGLERRANDIADPAWRSHYRDEVPVHRELLEQAAAWKV